MDWEYYSLKMKPKGFWGKIDTEDVDILLNQAGSQGWELVSATKIGAYGGTFELMLIFKRQR